MKYHRKIKKYNAQRAIRLILRHIRLRESRLYVEHGTKAWAFSNDGVTGNKLDSKNRFKINFTNSTQKEIAERYLVLKGFKRFERIPGNSNSLVIFPNKSFIKKNLNKKIPPTNRLMQTILGRFHQS